MHRLLRTAMIGNGRYDIKIGMPFWYLRLKFRNNAFSDQDVFWNELGHVFFELYATIKLQKARSSPHIRSASCSKSISRSGYERNGSGGRGEGGGKVRMLFFCKLH